MSLTDVLLPSRRITPTSFAHGDAAGTIAVIEGTLTERYATTTRPGPLTTRQLRPGSLTTFEADHVHEVRHDGATAAISIHVYTPTLDTMTFYPTTPDAPTVIDDASDADVSVLAHLAARVGSWL